MKKEERRTLRIAIMVGAYVAFLISMLAWPNIGMWRAIMLFNALSLGGTGMAWAGIHLWRWSERWIERGE